MNGTAARPGPWIAAAAAVAWASVGVAADRDGEGLRLQAAARAGDVIALIGNSEIAIEQVARRHDGAPVPYESLEQVERARFDAREVVVAAADGRMNDLRRTLRVAETEGSVQSGEREQSMARRSPLTGRAVRHTRTDDGWTASLDDDGPPLDDRWIAELEPTTDFVALLPGEPVSVGDTWSVPPAPAAALFRPFGPLTAPSDEPWAALMDQALDALDGEWSGRLDGLDEDGRVARLTFAGTLRAVAVEPDGALAARSIALRFEIAATLDFDVVLGGWTRLESSLDLFVSRAVDVIAAGGESARESNDFEGRHTLRLERQTTR